MSLFRLFNPTLPIRTRPQAECAADAAAAVWVIIALLFGFAALASAEEGGAAVGATRPAWAIFLGLGAAAGGLAILADRAKTLALAVLTLAAATLMSGYAVGVMFTGKANLALVPLLLMPLAVQGCRGARALKALSPPATGSGA